MIISSSQTLLDRRHWVCAAVPLNQLLKVQFNSMSALVADREEAVPVVGDVVEGGGDRCSDFARTPSIYLRISPRQVGL